MHMLLVYVPAVALASLLLILPGLVWAWWCFPAADRTTRVAVGVALGVALQMHLAAALAAGPGISATSVAFATCAVLAFAVFLAWRSRVRWVHLPAASSGRTSKAIKSINAPRTPTSRRGTILLVGTIALVVFVRLLPLVAAQLPLGWDPSFHSLLASTVVRSGKLPTWAPYEPIPINYPYGTHIIIADISLITGVAPAQVFAALIDGMVPLATALGMYALGRRLFHSPEYALAGVAAYGFLGYWGSIDYGMWGGLPNELGFSLVLVFLAVLFTPNPGVRHIVVGGVILGAIPLSHHHVTLTVVLLLGAFGAFLFVRTWRARYHDSGREAARRLRFLVLSSLVGCATVAYYALPMALRAGSLANTQVARLYEPIDNPFVMNGVVLEMLAAIGVVSLVAGAVWHTRWLGSVCRALRSTRAFLAVVSLTLVIAFVMGQYVYRFIAAGWLDPGHIDTLFTPSRFLTDLTYFLSLYAAVPLVALWEGTKQLGRRVADERAVIAGRGLLAMGMLAVALSLVAEQLAPGGGHLAPGEGEALSWIRTHTTGNTLVLNNNSTPFWAPYFTRRETAYTPVPTSEFTSGYVAEKQYLSDVLQTAFADHPIHVLAYAGRGTALPALSGRTVALASDRRQADLAAPAFARDGQYVFLLPAGFAFLQPRPAGWRVQWWQGQHAPAVSWQAAATSATGWSAAPPDRSTATRDVYLRLVFDTPLSGADVVSCQAQETASLYVDGVPSPHTCDGAWHRFARTATVRTLALHAQWSPSLQPWVDLFVGAPT